MSVFDGKTVLVTGGSGFFGNAFTQHLLEKCRPKKIIIFSRDEYKQSLMAEKWPDDGRCPIRYFLGDVRSRDRLDMAFRGVDIVVHAAALKRADRGEYDSDEFIETNVVGSRNVAHAAMDQGVGRVVALSSDKACSPCNMYGATKLCAEKLFVAAKSYSSQTLFSVCRYGNVHSSRGSVVQTFKELVAENKPLSVTSVSMTRFIISINDAIGLVETALTAEPGTVIVPKLPSVRILDIVEAIGGKDYPYTVTGLRAGEKIAESLINSDEPCFDAGAHYILAPGGTTGFRYASDTNHRFLTADEFRAML